MILHDKIFLYLFTQALSRELRPNLPAQTVARPNDRWMPKIESPRQLLCSVSAILCGLGGLKDPERARAAHVGSRQLVP